MCCPKMKIAAVPEKRGNGGKRNMEMSDENVSTYVLERCHSKCRSEQAKKRMINLFTVL